MSHNYFWRKVPKEYQVLLRRLTPDEQKDRLNPFVHIGHSAAAGMWCTVCGCTLAADSTQCLHDSDIHYSECPICQRSVGDPAVVPVYSFTVTQMRHIDILRSIDPFMISTVDENGIMISTKQMLDIIDNAIIVYQTSGFWL